jgi:hypothetical protein
MFRKFIACVMAVCTFSSLSFTQNAATTTTPATQPATATPSPKPAMQGFGLEDATPVKLRTSRTISSADAHTGDTLDFEVLEDVLVGGT